jgi:hypothetical protein
MENRGFVGTKIRGDDGAAIRVANRPADNFKWRLRPELGVPTSKTVMMVIERECDADFSGRQSCKDSSIPSKLHADKYAYVALQNLVPAQAV